MKVNAWKNIDVECEVDVSLDDCINEMLSIGDEDGMPRRKLSAIDGATKILERITPDDVASYLEKHPGGLTLIKERLQAWINAVNNPQFHPPRKP